MKTFSIGEAISYGWNTVKKQPKVIVYILVAVLGAQFINWVLSFVLGDSAQDRFIIILIAIITMVVSLVFSLGMVRILFNIYDNKPLKFENLYQDWKLVGRYLISSILGGLAILAGFILLIIPGIIFTIRLSFLPFVMLDGETHPIEALKKSWYITKGHTLKLLVFYIVQVLILMLGLLAFILGVFIAIPVIYLANVFIYKKLTEKSLPSRKAKTATTKSK